MVFKSGGAAGHSMLNLVILSTRSALPPRIWVILALSPCEVKLLPVLHNYQGCHILDYDSLTVPDGNTCRSMHPPKVMSQLTQLLPSCEFLSQMFDGWQGSSTFSPN
ncbi:hypothetical protein AVEN_23670-1 [Araneus ventricosus]|uniref:Uncharacterized protein n=1 Tax=Araneus ventricosus TaxID=182803 RepID=A0A4Y2BH99_ARAVE|nr:hypothetical protein AVEN_23670-1 [Araneus ventricosus]